MKNIRQEYEQYFSEANLTRIFNANIVYSGGTGIDNINQYTFRNQQQEQIRILSSKMINGRYKFTKYKLSLISKGRGKVPREISIPTVRDRIALRAMCEFLQARFKASLNFQLPQQVVREIKGAIATGNYSGCIKLDVANFYPSINHQQLEKQLDKRLRRHPSIKNVMFSAITVPTVISSQNTDMRSTKGVPQGLAISNVLAAIYLQDLDKYLNKLPNIKAFRYVDDILILCDNKNAEIISKDVISKFNKYSLDIHCPIKMPHKSSIGRINDGFDYLGYDFQDQLVSVKPVSVEKIKSSLVGIFTSYKYADKQSKEFLNWRVNLRITGCVFENKSKGWLFFFTEINDEPLLHKLDHFVSKLCKRFNVDITPKKFVRAFKEISNNKYGTQYVPNFDSISNEEKANILSQYFGYNLANMRQDQINFAFHKKVSRQIKDLESDIKDFSVSA
jgi:RNA-directed DNA polymerase